MQLIRIVSLCDKDAMPAVDDPNVRKHEAPYTVFAYENNQVRVWLLDKNGEPIRIPLVADAIISAWEDAIINAAEAGEEIDVSDLPHIHITLSIQSSGLMKLVPLCDEKFKAWAERDTITGVFSYRLWNLIRGDVKEMCQNAFNDLSEKEKKKLRAAAGERN